MNEVQTPNVEHLENEDCSHLSCCAPKEPTKRVGEKIGRNDPCICGNGKKFKKCCGKNL